MLKVGITGGMGSGKSTVCRIFEYLGIPVYYADDRAKGLMVHQPELKQQIIHLLGADAYLPDGALNRPYISRQVFGNDPLLQALNALVHPAVHRDAEDWHRRQQAPFTLREAALLYESGSYRMMDKMIVVTAPMELRLSRVIQRDKLRREEVMARIARQWPEEDKVAKADFVITNDGEQGLLVQVLQLYQRLLTMA
jgi:dephospho-CoA kinase